MIYLLLFTKNPMMNFCNGYKKASFYGRQNFANVEMKCHNITTNKETNEVIEDKWPIWRCNSRKNHNGKNSRRVFWWNFFSGTHLSSKQILEFSYYWCRKTHNQKEYIHDIGGLATHTVVGWCMFCRDVTAEYFVSNPQKIGFKKILILKNKAQTGKLWKLMK